MKKAIVGLVALGAMIGVRPLVKRMHHRMFEKCEQMARQVCGRSEAVGRT